MNAQARPSIEKRDTAIRLPAFSFPEAFTDPSGWRHPLISEPTQHLPQREPSLPVIQRIQDPITYSAWLLAGRKKGDPNIEDEAPTDEHGLVENTTVTGVNPLDPERTIANFQNPLFEDTTETGGPAEPKTAATGLVAPPIPVLRPVIINPSEAATVHDANLNAMTAVTNTDFELPDTLIDRGDQPPKESLWEDPTDLKGMDVPRKRQAFETTQMVRIRKTPRFAEDVTEAPPAPAPTLILPPPPAKPAAKFPLLGRIGRVLAWPIIRLLRLFGWI